MFCFYEMLNIMFGKFLKIRVFRKTLKKPKTYEGNARIFMD
jgi:hypothetical protein